MSQRNDWQSGTSKGMTGGPGIRIIKEDDGGLGILPYTYPAVVDRPCYDGTQADFTLYPRTGCADSEPFAAPLGPNGKL